MEQPRVLGYAEDGVLIEPYIFKSALKTSITQCKVVLDYVDENNLSRNVIPEVCIIQSEYKLIIIGLIAN